MPDPIPMRPDPHAPARAEASEGATDPWADVETAVYRQFQHPGRAEWVVGMLRECRAAVEAAHRQEIERLTQERNEAASSAHRVYEQYSFVCERLEKAEAERDALAAQIVTLREALAKADEGIVRGQACRSESEFVRWMHEVQALRPSATLLAATEGGTK